MLCIFIEKSTNSIMDVILIWKMHQWYLCNLIYLYVTYCDSIFETSKKISPSLPDSFWYQIRLVIYKIEKNPSAFCNTEIGQKKS